MGAGCCGAVYTLVHEHVVAWSIGTPPMEKVADQRVDMRDLGYHCKTKEKASKITLLPYFPGYKSQLKTLREIMGVN